MNTNSNSYTIIYASVMVVIVAFLLAFVSSSLRETQNKNVELDTKKQILAALNIKDVKDAEVEYNKYVKGDMLMNVDGTLTENTGAFATAYEKEAKENNRLHVFVAEVIRTSVFVSTDAEMIEYAAKAGADRVELYTEPYATAYPKGREAAVAPFVEAAKVARSLGLGLNAGHDLSLVNLNYFYQNIPWLDEVSIGHALISDALYLGLERTVKEYKNCLR